MRIEGSGLAVLELQRGISRRRQRISLVCFNRPPSRWTSPNVKQTKRSQSTDMALHDWVSQLCMCIPVIFWRKFGTESLLVPGPRNRSIRGVALRLCWGEYPQHTRTRSNHPRVLDDTASYILVHGLLRKTTQYGTLQGHI